MTRLERWDGRAEWPLAVAALAFLTAYAYPILDDRLSRPAHRLCDIVLVVTWAVFVVDFIARVYLAEQCKRYVLHHLHDLVILGVPVLRPLRLLRLLVLLRVLNRQAADSLRGRVAACVRSTWNPGPPPPPTSRLYTARSPRCGNNWPASAATDHLRSPNAACARISPPPLRLVV